MKKKKNKLFVQIALLLGTLISLFFVPWLLLWAWIRPLPNNIQEQLDQAINYSFDGIIVYIDQANHQPKTYTSGWHNKANKTPAQPNALFKIASISKLFTAVAITKFAAKQKISLDKTVAYYLPELVGRIQNAESITLKMLVQHKSGIPNFTDTPNFWASPTKSYAESLALILDKPANFAPGTDYEYCNTNYLLLNKIMDNVLGYDHYTFIEQEIITPLELKNTYKSLQYVDTSNVMSGYHIGYPFDLKNNDHGMLATAKDIGTFLRALNNGTIFKQGEQEIYSSIYKYNHGGWVPGYQSFANYDKDLDAVVVCFYSTTDAELYNWNLSEIINNRIIRLVIKEKY